MILDCARLCVDSYRDYVGFYEEGDLRFGVFHIDGLNVLCIRGSDNKGNWLSNANILPTRSPKGYLVHRGFNHAADKIRRHLGNTEIDVVTGHSFGGAVAIDLSEHYGCQAITFGAPKYYWRFQKVRSQNHIRIVRDDDPVPMVPRYLFDHKNEAIILKDSDGNKIQFKDHSMSGYYDAVKRASLF